MQCLRSQRQSITKTLSFLTSILYQETLPLLHPFNDLFSSYNTRACFRDVPGRLMFCRLCRDSKVCYQQTTTSVERSRLSGQWHEEVRLWSDAATTHQSTLAWRPWARQVQTLHDDVPMPGRHCSTVSDSTLDTSLWDCVMTACVFGCQPSTDSSATSTGYTVWSGVCCRRSVDMQLTAETFMQAF